MDPLLLVVQLLSHVWLCDLMNCSTPDFPIFHHLSSSPWVHTHAHWVSDAIQISHPGAPFSSFPLVFLAWGSFPISWIFVSGDQNIGASASALVLPMNIQSWFPLGLTNLIFLLSKGLSRVFSSTTVWKHQFFVVFMVQFFMVQLSHPYMTIGKTIALTIWTFVSKVISLLFTTLSRFVRAILPRTSDL